MDSDKITQPELDKLLEEFNASTSNSDGPTITNNVKFGIIIISIDGITMGANSNAKVITKINEIFDTVESHVILDLKNCSFFSSIAIGYMINWINKLKTKNSKLICVGANSQIKELFKISNMGILIKIFDTHNEANQFLNTLPS